MTLDPCGHCGKPKTTPGGEHRDCGCPAWKLTPQAIALLEQPELAQWMADLLAALALGEYSPEHATPIAAEVKLQAARRDLAARGVPGCVALQVHQPATKGAPAKFKVVTTTGPVVETVAVVEGKRTA